MEHIAQDMHEQPELTVGQILQQARTAKQFTIEHVAEQLRLTKQRIASLENDRFNEGEPEIFIRGYLRSYAKLLNLNPDELIAAVNFKTKEKPRQAKQAITFDRRFIYAGVVLALFVLLFLLQKAISASYSVEKAITGGQLRNDLASLTTQAAPVLAEAPVTTQPIAETAVVNTPEIAPLSESRLALEFNDNCWVEVYDAAKTKLYVGLKSEGDELALAGQAPFDVLLGNPRAVAMQINDHEFDLSSYDKKRATRMRVG